MKPQELKLYLNKKVEQYNQPSFIERDPISIPHRFTKKQDIEISGFFAALFAWGNRTIIINKSNDLLNRMDNAPHDFICNHNDHDLKKIIGFKHRTFQDGDILFLLQFLKQHYLQFDSLEDAFLIQDLSSIEVDNKLTVLGSARTDKKNGSAQTDNENWIMENALRNFYDYAFSFPHLKRSEKHIATPAKNSACKRINMFLRWMVRQDNCGVDFGIWQRIKPADLIIPLDVHVTRVSKNIGLLHQEIANWQQAITLTNKLKALDPLDPVKYDYALFSLGVIEKY